MKEIIPNEESKMIEAFSLAALIAEVAVPQGRPEDSAGWLSAEAREGLAFVAWRVRDTLREYLDALNKGARHDE